VRDWHRIEDYKLTPEGACPDCGTVVPGRFEAFGKQFGRRRIPLFLNRAA
jgi:pyruvate formate lyase activating enzyme